MGTGERRTILIVEDDADLRSLYKVALRLAGFSVVESGDAVDALQRLDRETPDLVVLDIGLPGLSGLVVQQEIAAHAHTRSIPIVVVTGSDMSLDHLELPFVLRKPVSPDRLIGAVRKCLPGGAPVTGS